MDAGHDNMKVLLAMALVVAALALSSCAAIKENVERPYGFVPAENAECQWGIMGQGMGSPFKAKAGAFEKADTLAYNVICRNAQGDYIPPGTCYEIACDVPSERILDHYDTVNGDLYSHERMEPAWKYMMPIYNPMPIFK